MPEFEGNSGVDRCATSRRRASRLAACAVALAALLVAACAMPPSKEEQDAAKNTFACMFVDERIVIRFDTGEARLLMPDGNRVALYQIPVRFRRPVFQRRHGAARQGHGLAAREPRASRRSSRTASRSWCRRSSGADGGSLSSRRRRRHRRHGRRRRGKPGPGRHCHVGADIRARAQARAVGRGATPTDPPRRAGCARRDVVIVLVVDAEQVETVLFGVDGVTTARSARAHRARVVDRGSGLHVAALAPRLSVFGIALLRRARFTVDLRRPLPER